MPGIVANFRELDRLVSAVRELQRQRLGDVTVYSPTVHHELEDVIGAPTSPVRRFTLVGGLLSASFGYWISIWTSDYWPLVTGGKAIASWIPYTIISFEMMVLVGALSTVFGMFINSRLPKLVLDVGFDPRFTNGDYGIYVQCPPEKERAAQELFGQHGASEVRHAR
ncbi:MAG: DUF3341 domain-containing protein [Gemmatimonadetes bacterium]|nr:DUF3341 domain-containing protein [Gemmatimonadota bacterium]